VYARKDFWSNSQCLQERHVLSERTLCFESLIPLRIDRERDPDLFAIHNGAEMDLNSERPGSVSRSVDRRQQ